MLRDYVEMLVDTGARPGIELLDMKWKQIRFMMNPVSTITDRLDEEGEVIEVHSLNRSCEMTVKGKTGQSDDSESIGAAVAVGRFINDLQLPPSLLLFLDQVHAQELNRRLR